MPKTSSIGTPTMWIPPPYERTSTPLAQKGGARDRSVRLRPRRLFDQDPPQSGRGWQADGLRAQRRPAQRDGGLRIAYGERSDQQARRLWETEGAPRAFMWRQRLC